MPKVFFTADTHFGHGNIIEHCGRPFANADEMDDAIIGNWNGQVKEEDDVWHLGDFAWRNHASYLSRLNGKIHLILGNHDKMSAYVRDSFRGVYDFYDGRVSDTSPRFFLFHYPMVSWPKKHKNTGTLHLYGHVHGRYDHPGDPSIDVGVDCRSFTLFPLDEVVSIIEEKVKTSGHNPCHVNKKEENTDAK